MKKYKAIIFDVGDTIVKWFPDKAQLYSLRLKSIGIAVDDVLEKEIFSAVFRAELEQQDVIRIIREA